MQHGEPAPRAPLGRGIPLAGFLEIDAYLRDDTDDSVPVDRAFAVDVEYSYLPGPAFGGVHDASAPNYVLVNLDLCTPEERELFEEMFSRPDDATPR